MSVLPKKWVPSKQDWTAAEEIARELSPYVDRNELGKVVNYFQRVRDKERFFELLNRLPKSGYTRSRKTREYLDRIRDVCQRHLEPITDDGQALAIVSWAFRLVSHYQTVQGQRYPDSRRTYRGR